MIMSLEELAPTALVLLYRLCVDLGAAHAIAALRFSEREEHGIAVGLRGAAMGQNRNPP
jgi:hypothetical protein